MSKKNKVIAIIPARGGSKGIKRKNLINFCGKPLIYWTINQCVKSKLIKDVWVSSDNEEILDFANNQNVNTIKRPKNISHSNSTSEEAWLHAINIIEQNHNFDLIITPQVTSPVRDNDELDKAIKFFIKKKYDSIFSGEEIKDYFVWEKKLKKIRPINYLLKKRLLRQKINTKYHENGSFYIFNKNKFKNKKIRLFGNIGVYKMSNYKSFQIDDYNDLYLVENLMNKFILKK